jgi:beta-1,4-N-acetylglucosaminyltransferase
MIFEGISIAVVVLVLFFWVGVCCRVKKDSKTSTRSVMCIFGSGGHTTEMILLIKNLGSLPQFGPFHFVLSHSDETSVSKIKTSNLSVLEKSNIDWHIVHRSREVRQSWFSTIFTTLLALFQSFDLVCKTLPSVIICNGPGTCVPICFSAFILRLLLLPVRRYRPSIVFVESFCRVQRLSLTGKLLYPIADKFIVQWPQLLSKKTYPRAICLSDASFLSSMIEHQQD